MSAVFIKKSKRPPQALARQREKEEEGIVESDSVIRAPRKRDLNPLIQSSAPSKRARKNDDESDEEKDFRVNFSSTRNVSLDSRSLPTYLTSFMASNATRGDYEREQEQILAGDDALKSSGVLDDGLYHGSKNYKSQLPVGSAKYTAVAGPSNVRQITITDYQPDVCKDYKETGFCGFGDSCKFLHDRGDYLAGWQLDNMYLSNRPKATAQDAEEEEEDKLPFACLICRQPFTDPIVTKCGHFFDSACAIARFAKTPKCFACGTPTGGLFNKADKIFAKRDKATRLKAEHDELEKGYDEGGEGLDVDGLDDLGFVPDEEKQSEQDSGSEHEYYEEDEPEEMPTKRKVQYVIEK